ncbi:MAG: PIN domain-containing protein [bacterium]|nr:PIN domain-containing protein [bacterium]
MIFLDTSGIYALADRDDQYHDDAMRILNLALERNEEIVTHNYVIVESAALLQRRLGLDIAVRFLRDVHSFTIIWIDDDMHESAVEYLERENPTKVSLVDALSFHTMRNNGIDKYLGFDKHFDDAGFSVYA